MDLSIRDIALSRRGLCYQIEAKIGFQQLWFRLPCTFKPDVNDASPFVVSALIPAMFLGQDIIVQTPYFVSKKLLSQLDEIQTIYHEWNPSFKKVNIIARGEESKTRRDIAGSFFSGGVDGTYTMMKHLDEIDCLILINGFDFGMGNITWRAMVERNKGFVESFNKQLVAIETNFKTFILNYGVARVSNHGAQLSAIGILLGFERYFISGGTTYSQIKPDGAHPLVDHLWNTESSKFFHMGLEADRSKKLNFLKKFPDALSRLWVCWKGPNDNCGNCSKCVRTYVALLLNDAADAIKFKQPVDINRLKKVSLNNEHDFNCFSNFRVLAVQRGDKKIQKILDKILLKYRVKQFLLDCDKYLLNDLFLRYKRRKLGSVDANVKVSLVQRYSDEINRRQISKYTASTSLTENNSVVGSIYFDDRSLDKDTNSAVPSS